MGETKQVINIFHVAEKIIFDDFDQECWRTAEPVLLKQYWSGDAAPPERRAAARLVWTDAALLGRFDCQQNEPLIVNPAPQINIEAENLWERDVCELFIAPDKNRPEKYFEFEVAPTGEWLDYSILQLPDSRQTDTAYNSGFKTLAQIRQNSFSIIFQIEWQALGKKPETGEEWLGNLFRCVGAGASRGYLAWQPTLTSQPDFHVPGAFGIFKFKK